LVIFFFFKFNISIFSFQVFNLRFKSFHIFFDYLFNFFNIYLFWLPFIISFRYRRRRRELKSSFFVLFWMGFFNILNFGLVLMLVLFLLLCHDFFLILSLFLLKFSTFIYSIIDFLLNIWFLLYFLLHFLLHFPNQLVFCFLILFCFF